MQNYGILNKINFKKSKYWGYYSVENLANNCESINESYTIEQYISIIDIIIQEHNNHYYEWVKNHKKPIDLKKTQVNHIFDLNSKIINENFRIYMNSYINSLNFLYLKLADRINNNLDVKIIGRTKDQSSIILKLSRKMDDCDGKFPINKYLNDLLGIRIIDNSYNYVIKDLKKHIENIDRVRCYEKFNEFYRGFHIYFQGPCNFAFPIELQVWDKKDEINNLNSHEIYKKEYTKWVKKY